MVGFGVRGHDFGFMPASELARRAKGSGFSFIQLAPAKALSDYPGPSDPEAELKFAASVSRSFAAEGVRISVLGCYIDPLDPDPAKRKSEHERFRRGISLCEAYGADMVATETGPYPDADEKFSALVKIVAGWADMAEKAGARVAIEPVFGHTLSDPRSARRLLDEVASPSIGIVYDPANLVDPAAPDAQSQVFARAIGLLGEKIMAVHAKDFTIREGRKISAVPGAGLMDWTNAFRGIGKWPLSPPILIEDQRPQDMKAARSFIESVIQDA